MSSATGLSEKLDKKYLIKRQIGKGTFADVYEVASKEHTTVPPYYVAKVSKFLQPNSIALDVMAVNELSALQNLHHPNVVEIIEFDFNFDRNESIIIMEWCSMGTLDDYSNLGHDLSARIILLHHVVCGLNYLHKQNRIHFDLKPTNVLIDQKLNVVTKKMGYVAKIADFGLSRRAFANHEKIHRINSSIFTAPEILCGTDRASTKSDVWSLGMLAIHLFFGSEHGEKPQTTHDIAQKKRKLIQEKDIMLDMFQEQQLAIDQIKKSCSKELPIKNDESGPFQILQFCKDRPSKRQALLHDLFQAQKLDPRLYESIRHEALFNAIIDFILNCLDFDQEKRLSAEQLLQTSQLFQLETHGCQNMCQVTKTGSLFPLDTNRNINLDKPIEAIFNHLREFGTIQPYDLKQLYMYTKHIYYQYDTKDKTTLKFNNSLDIQAACLAISSTLLDLQNEISSEIIKITKHLSLKEFLAVQFEISSVLKFQFDIL